MWQTSWSDWYTYNVADNSHLVKHLLSLLLYSGTPWCHVILCLLGHCDHHHSSMWSLRKHGLEICSSHYQNMCETKAAENKITITEISVSPFFSCSGHGWMAHSTAEHVKYCSGVLGSSFSWHTHAHTHKQDSCLSRKDPMSIIQVGWATENMV